MIVESYLNFFMDMSLFPHANRLDLLAFSGMNNREVLEQVDRGYRMQKASNTPDHVYEKMLECWDKDPEKRPTFEFLFTFFDDYFISTEPNYRESD